MRWRNKTLFYWLGLVFILIACGQDPIIPPEGPVALLFGPPDLLSVETPSTTLTISNPGNTKSSWSLRIRQSNTNPTSAQWFTLSAISGVLSAGQNATLTLNLNDNLQAGVYKTTLTFKYQKKSQSYQVIGVIGTGQFQIEATSTTNALTPTSPLTIPISLSKQDGFSGEVQLSLVGLPSGITGTFNPNPATTQSSLELSTDGTTAPGNYKLGILGKSNTLFATTSFSVLVASDNTQAGFSLALENPTLELATNGILSTKLAIQRSGGFATTINLSAENVPAGLTLGLEPSSVTDQTTLSLQASPTLAKGNYTINIKGLADTLESTSTLNLTITAKKSAKIVGKIITDNARVSSQVTSLAPSQTALPQIASNQAFFVPGQLLVKYKETPVSDLSTQAENRQLLSDAIEQDYGLRVLKAA